MNSLIILNLLINVGDIVHGLTYINTDRNFFFFLKGEYGNLLVQLCVCVIFIFGGMSIILLHLLSCMWRVYVNYNVL